MKTILTIITIALILSLIGNFIQYDLSKDSELGNHGVESARLSEIAHLKSQVAVRDSAVALLQTKMDSAQQSYKKSQALLKSNVMSLKRRELLSRIDTITRTLTDTVYLAYDSLVADLTKEREGILKDCHTLTDSLLANSTDLTAIATKWEASYHDSEKRVAKEVKKRKWLIRGLIILGAAFVFEEVRQ